jgi:hypothetical protein
MGKTTKQQQITVYLPPQLVGRLKDRAKNNHRSMNAELTVALEKHLEQQEHGKK